MFNNIAYRFISLSAVSVPLQTAKTLQRALAPAPYLFSVRPVRGTVKGVAPYTAQEKSRFSANIRLIPEIHFT